MSAAKRIGTVLIAAASMITQAQAQEKKDFCLL